MKKILLIITLIFIGNFVYSYTPTITPTMTPMMIMPTATITPALSKEEIIIWREKFADIKALPNIIPLYTKTLTDQEIINKVMIKPVAEIMAVKTVVATKPKVIIEEAVEK